MKKIVPVIVSMAFMAAAASAFAQTPHSDDATPHAPSAIEHKHRCAHGHLFKNKQLLSLLKMDADTLKRELKSGQSLADIAAKKGVPKQQLVDLLVEQKIQKIDKAVKEGKLSQDKAKHIKGKIEERIKRWVEFKRKMGDHRSPAS